MPPACGRRGCAAASAALAFSLLLAWPQPAAGFIEEMLNGAFGGGGGGFQFEMGGGGGMEHMFGGRQQRQPRKPKWPKGVTDKIAKSMSWMKGTEWNWNSWRNVKFEKDGNFDAPTQDCAQGQCKWSAKGNKVWILWGEAGLHELDLAGEPPVEQDQKKMQGMRLKGKRVADGERCSATFQRVFDFEAAELDKDLYEIMGLPDDATEVDLKKSYRKLSIKHHPDKNPDEESKKKFAAIRDAYEILNDADKKILYDTGGMEAVKKHEKGEVQKGDDVSSSMTVGLEELYTGSMQKARVQRRVVCRGCSKRPDSPSCRSCQRCPNELKTVHVQVGAGMFMQQQQEVQSKEKCKDEDAELDAQVERGMRDGESLTFPRMAEQKPGQLPGNVILTLKARKHNKFVRQGDSLHLKVQISLREALLGWAQTIKHLDGHRVEVGTTSVTKPFQVFKIKGEGMPLRDDPATFGDMIITAEILFPKTLTSDQQGALEGVFAPAPPRPEL